jgi:hypothetical protein
VFVEKKFKLKLSGPGLDLDTSISEAQAKIIFNVAFSAGTVEGEGVATASEGIASTRVPGPGGVPAPKDFVAQKNPMNEQERVTCLAYYLYKYRKVEKFSAKELRDLNSAAAQPRFHNISYIARDAVNTGYLASAGGGKKTISALGERVVDAMPSREKIADVFSKFGKKKRKKGPARAAT